MSKCPFRVAKNSLWTQKTQFLYTECKSKSVSLNCPHHLSVCCKFVIFFQTKKKKKICISGCFKSNNLYDQVRHSAWCTSRRIASRRALMDLLAYENHLSWIMKSDQMIWSEGTQIKSFDLQRTLLFRCALQLLTLEFFFSI